MLPLQQLISSIKPDFIAGIESRGFITAFSLAFQEMVGFIAIRKANELPSKVFSVNYQPDYCKDRLEIKMNLF